MIRDEDEDDDAEYDHCVVQCLPSLSLFLSLSHFF